MACVASGAVLAVFLPTVGDLVLRLYSAVGSILQTYDVTEAGYFLDRFRLEPAGVYFWEWFQSDAVHPRTGLWRRVAVSDGTVASSFTASLNERSGLGETLATPFVASDSCPLLFIAAPITPPVPDTITYPLRRERIFPLPFDQNNWMFPSRIEFIIQSGVGLNGNQGVAPVLLVSFSKDGGITWGTEFQVGMGPPGATEFRAYINRLSRYRNGAVKVACTDPVFFAMLDATIGS